MSTDSGANIGARIRRKELSSENWCQKVGDEVKVIMEAQPV